LASVLQYKLVVQWPRGMVPDLRPQGRGFESHPRLLRRKFQLSLPSLWGWLMSTSKSWGVNGHTM